MSLFDKLKGRLRRGEPAPKAAPPRSTEVRARVHAVRRMPTPAWASASEPFDWYAVELSATSSSSKVKAFDLLLVGDAKVGVSDARIWNDESWESAEGQSLWGECRLRLLFAMPPKASGTWHLCAEGRSLGAVDLKRAELAHQV